MRRGAGGGRMMPERRPARLARRIITIAVAGCASALLLGLLAVGFGTAPALGPALVPWHGAWTSAVGGKLPGAQTLTLRGLAHRAEVSFTGQGTAAISATSDNDAFLALGYVHAEFRLAEMDLERRLGAGRLAQLAGPSAVASDKFELRLGLLRTAQQEWAQTPRSSPDAQALIWYSRGVNDYLARARATGQWPALFSLAGVYPADWTPVDSLVIQGDLTQELNFTTTPLDYALLERSLGVQHTMQWFPVLPVSQQSPYDPGPYRNLGTAPIPASGTLLPAARKPPARAGPAASPVSAPEARAAASLLAQVSALPAGQVHGYPDSNAWAASATPAWARPRSWRDWRSGSWPETSLSHCAASALWPWTWARWWRAPSTGANSRSGSRLCSARSSRARGRSSRSSMSCIPWAGRARQRAPWMRATCSSPCLPGASCAWSARRRSMSTASGSRRTRRWSAGSSRSSSASRRWRTPSRSCAGSRSAMRPIIRSRSPMRPWWPRPRWPTGTSRHASCRTRRLTWWTKQHRGCAWRSTRARSKSTSCSDPSTG